VRREPQRRLHVLIRRPRRDERHAVHAGARADQGATLGHPLERGSRDARAAGILLGHVAMLLGSDVRNVEWASWHLRTGLKMHVLCKFEHNALGCEGG